MNTIYRLAKQFRNAMNQAKNARCFDNIPFLNHFPNGSCGETCYLLAEFLLEHGIYTELIEGGLWRDDWDDDWGNAYSWPHAWLVVVEKEEWNQKRIEPSISIYRQESNGNSNDYEAMLNAIQNNKIENFDSTPPDYPAELSGRIIIDITGDQFHNNPKFLCYDVPVYVGEMDKFHCLFEIRDIRECAGLDSISNDKRHCFYELYQKIKEYIDK